MADNSHAYNSVWQLRGDAWCRLEEADDRLTGTTSSTELKEQYGAVCIDQDFDQKVSEAFQEAYEAHTSTSPNYQILASLDFGRRQVALEGVELVQRQIENAMQLRDAIDDHPLLSKYMACLRTSDLIPNEFRPSGIAQPLRSGLRNMMAV